jgi:hypothetical protein
MLRTQTVYNPELIRALVDDRERAIVADLRRRQLTDEGDHAARWVRPPPRRRERR